jgi:hypothetical protein
MLNDSDALRQAIADGNGFELYCHYPEAQAAKVLKMHAVTLKKLRLDKQISHVRLGKRNVGYFGYQIADFFIEKISCHETKPENSKLEIGGLANEKTASAGMPAPMTNGPSAADVSALAQRIFQ